MIKIELDEKQAKRIVEMYNDFKNIYMLNQSYDIRELISEIENALNEKQKEKTPKLNPQARAKAAVYATGNKWAIENWNATH